MIVLGTSQVGNVRGEFFGREALPATGKNVELAAEGINIGGCRSWRTIRPTEGVYLGSLGCLEGCASRSEGPLAIKVVIWRERIGAVLPKYGWQVMTGRSLAEHHRISAYLGRLKVCNWVLCGAWKVAHLGAKGM